MTRREVVIRILEGFSRLSLWTFIVALIWGMVDWMIGCLNNTQIPIYIRLAIGSIVILVLSLFFIFALDDEVF